MTFPHDMKAEDEVCSGRTHASQDISISRAEGTTTSSATGVTVNGTNALRYNDATFAATNMPLTTTYTAVASDSYGRHSTNTASVSLSTNVAYQYDGNGNLTNDGLRNFLYDDENQLVQVFVSNQWKSVFSYDGKMRRRIRQEYVWQSGIWHLQSEMRYVYDGNEVIQERDQNNLPTVTYTRGLDLSGLAPWDAQLSHTGSLDGAGGIGGLLARTDNTSGQTAYYHSDGNGNITMLINATQSIVAKYLYDAFGNTLSAAGSLAQANLYRFSSKETHPNSGLVYYLYRYYDPNLQRWPNRDPLEENGFEVLKTLETDFAGIDPDDDESVNLYEFVSNMPINKTDAFGLFLGWGYGNWCGWSRSGPGAPIDEVDAACMKHDYCLATWADACEFEFCNIRLCANVARAHCHGNKACKKAKRTILAGCILIVPIPPFIHI